MVHVYSSTYKYIIILSFLFCFLVYDLVIILKEILNARRGEVPSAPVTRDLYIDVEEEKKHQRKPIKKKREYTRTYLYVHVHNHPGFASLIKIYNVCANPYSDDATPSKTQNTPEPDSMLLLYSYSSCIPFFPPYFSMDDSALRVFLFRARVDCKFWLAIAFNGVTIGSPARVNYLSLGREL